MKEVFYEGGKLNGSSTTWWINGLIQETGGFRNNQKDGVFTGFHENGRKAYEARFKDGLLMSLDKWTPTGERVSDDDGPDPLIREIEEN